MNKKTSLFGLFINKDQLSEALKYIKNNFEVSSNKVFMYNGRGNLLLSFTASSGERNLNTFFKVIKLQRNRDNNTFFTLDALNHIIKDETGSENETYKVDFSKYQDSILYKRNDRLCQNKLIFKQSFNLENTDSFQLILNDNLDQDEN